MQLDHERLDVYELALEFLVQANAALLDVCLGLRLLDDAGHKTAKAMLVRIVSMLVKLAHCCEE
jgi:hypothetical protein